MVCVTPEVEPDTTMLEEVWRWPGLKLLSPPVLATLGDLQPVGLSSGRGIVLSLSLAISST